mmetsp:Transcript_31519/g.77675  ORF Transcript_31519/g.77675 Transcript_31519/m.77675 type:complete len:87 (+) Transcript_31519:94-354(+)
MPMVMCRAPPVTAHRLRLAAPHTLAGIHNLPRRAYRHDELYNRTASGLSSADTGYLRGGRRALASGLRRSSACDRPCLRAPSASVL